jgi:hypothetical protein
MSIYSKCFTEITKHIDCQQFIHPESRSCWVALWRHSQNVLTANMRLFVPIAFVIWARWSEKWGIVWLKWNFSFNPKLPMALKLNQFDWNLLVKHIIDWFLFTINGVYISGTIVGGACSLWWAFFLFLLFVPIFFFALPFMCDKEWGKSDPEQ